MCKVEGVGRWKALGSGIQERRASIPSADNVAYTCAVLRRTLIR